LFGSTPADDQEPTAAALLQQAIEKFFRAQDMAAAERLLRQALAKKDIATEQKSQALFYLGGALGRQPKYEEAVQGQDEWLRANGPDPLRHYVLLFQGIYQQALGHAAVARECWQTIVREAPESDLAKHARTQLADGAEASVSEESTGAADGTPITRPLPH